MTATRHRESQRGVAIRGGKDVPCRPGCGNNPLNLTDPSGLTPDGPSAPDAINNLGGAMTSLIMGGGSGGLIRTIGGLIIDQLLPNSAPFPNVGDLCNKEVNQIQSVVN